MFGGYETRLTIIINWGAKVVNFRQFRTKFEFALFKARMKPIYLLIFLVFFFSNLAFGQYKSNPLANKEWLNSSLGANTADNISWQMAATYSKRSDVLITAVRLGYSQEFIESAADSVTSKKNKIIEAGMMWGEGYGGEHWYASIAGGMGLNVRRYADDIEDTTLVRVLTGVTIGVPVQLELGLLFNENWGASATALANWNFRQPYVGLHVGVVYRPSKKKKQ